MNCPEDRRLKFRIGASINIKIFLDLNRLQRNRHKKRFIEIGFKSLDWFWVTFSLSSGLVYNNNIIKANDHLSSLNMFEVNEHLPLLIIE